MKKKGSGCIFQTKDGIWWNIEDIQRTVIYLKKGGITENNKNEITRKANDPNNMDAFVLVSRFDNNNILRINDLAFETNNDFNNSKTLLEKLYGFINGQNVNVPVIANQEPEGDQNPPVEVCDHYCRYIRGDFSQACTDQTTTSCSLCKYNGTAQGNICDIYDENGNRAVKSMNCDKDYNSCERVNTYEDDGSTLKTTKVGCYDGGDECMYEFTTCEGENRKSCAVCSGGSNGTCTGYDENGNANLYLSACSGSLAYYDSCKNITIINDTEKITYENCNYGTGVCQNIYGYTADGTTRLYRKSGCYKNDICNWVYSDYLNGDTDKAQNAKEYKYNTESDGRRVFKFYNEHIYSYDSGSKMEIYTNKECNMEGICGWQDTLNNKGKRTFKKFNYNSNTGEYSYYHENIYASDGTTIIGTRECYSPGNCYKCTKSGC